MLSAASMLSSTTRTRLPPEERIRRGVAYIAQQRSYFPSQSVADNLRLGAATNFQIVPELVKQGTTTVMTLTLADTPPTL